jgi:hypothetical protein
MYLDFQSSAKPSPPPPAATEESYYAVLVIVPTAFRAYASATTIIRAAGLRSDKAYHALHNAHRSVKTMSKSSWNNKDVSVEKAALPVCGRFSCEALPNERISAKLNE